MRPLFRPVALTGLVVVLLSLGTATAAKLITGKDIANHSITGRDIKRNSVPLAALRGASTPATAGKDGAPGERGEPGIVGEPGPAGEPGLDRVSPLDGPIQSSIPPDPDPQFIGAPSEIDFADGDHGVIEATVGIGAEGEIDDPAKFSVGICVEEEGVATPIVEEGTDPGDPFGVSPTIAAGSRVAVTVSTPFVVLGEVEGLFGALLGPCVLNETGTPLDNNDRKVGYVLTSF